MTRDLKIFVADRLAFQRRILQLILEKEGMSVAAEAGSFPELSAQMEAVSSESKLLFCDSTLVEEETLGLMENWARDHAVIVTGTPEDEDLFKQTLEAGARTFLLKPYTLEKVKQALFDADIIAGDALKRNDEGSED